MHYHKDDFIDAEGTTQTLDKSSHTSTTLKLGSNPNEISLFGDKGAWAGIPRSKRLCSTCKDMDAIEDEEHILLKCPAYIHIKQKFNSLLKDNKDIWNVLIESPEKTVGIYVTKVLSYREHFLSLR